MSHICCMLNSLPPFSPLPHPSSSLLTCLFISVLRTGAVSSGSLSSSLLWGECALMGAIASQQWIALVRCVFTPLSLLMRDKKQPVLLRRAETNKGNCERTDKNISLHIVVRGGVMER